MHLYSIWPLISMSKAQVQIKIQATLVIENIENKCDELR